MNSVITSFNGLFAHTSDASQSIARVRVPIVQRDYAQGREDQNATRIREAFLDVLHGALTGDACVVLDFVFGDVKGGTFTPLDGQQRLTTLFLLHWYLAARSDGVGGDGWKGFTYETRASARAFCEAIISQRPAFPLVALSTWIKDQPWFLSTWRHDPTVRAMLVMLDAIHRRFGDADCTSAWRRLVDVERPTITFHLLPIAEMGRPDDLYIKMNCRGKPLTPFETFKALFEKTLESVDAARAKHFAERIDGAWSDMLWPLRGDDNLIDDEFMRYLHFVTEVCEWTEGRSGSGTIDTRADATFGPTNSRASENLTWLFAALDAWCGEDSKTCFDRHFALDRHEPGRVTVYAGRGEKHVNLLEACCRDYGAITQNAREFSLERSLLLYAMVVHRAEKTVGFPRRLRVLRNLFEASASAIRPDAMPVLVRVVRSFVIDGDLTRVTGLSKRQIEEEIEKAKLLAEYPELAPTLDQLEDNPLLRGCLAAFTLDAQTLAARAEVFERLFRDKALRGTLTGALLACGEYAQSLRGHAHRFQFGTGSKENDDVWRSLFSGSELGETRSALSALLDRFAIAEGSPTERLEAIRHAWLAEREGAAELDWRYYLVRYPAMREGASGIYVGLNGSLGYSLCMLTKLRLSGYYRDPYLLAILRRSGPPSNAVRDPWFTGYEHLERWLHLEKSGVELRCVSSRIEVKPPAGAAYAKIFAEVCVRHGLQVDGHLHVLAVPQVSRGGRDVDTKDRIELGAALLRDLVDAGC